MSMKKVVFYSYNVHDAITQSNVTKDVKEIFDEIFNSNAVKNDNEKTLELNKKNSIVYLDILENNETYLFGRLGKEKDIRTIAIRDKTTKASLSILQGEELETKNVESNTYFLLDYQDALVAFVKGLDSPAISNITYILSDYDQYRAMTLDRIVSPERVKSLMKQGSAISKIHYSFLLPSVEVLSHIGFTPQQVEALRDSELYEGVIILKNKPRRPITANANIITKFIDSVKDTDLARRITLSGKEPTSRTQNYKFNESDISYEIDYPNTRTIDGEKIRLTPQEMANKIHANLVSLYKENRSDILVYCGKI